MATLRQDLGPVTAYAYAVSEGYTGTEEEFAEVLANFADSAEQVAADAAQVALDKGAVHDDKEAVDSAEGRVTSAVNTFTTTTAPNAVTAVENAGTAQIGLVEAEGTRQIGLVADKGTEQVGTVSSEGTTQIGLVEAKGAEVIASIPGDYSTLQGDIASTYSSSSTYAVGDYVLYSGQLYRCTTAISTAEAWTSAKWTAVALGDDVTDLKSAFDDLIIISDEQPTAENNKIWIDSTSTSVQVPTMDEYNVLLNNLPTATASGSVAYIVDGANNTPIKSLSVESGATKITQLNKNIFPLYHILDLYNEPDGFYYDGVYYTLKSDGGVHCEGTVIIGGWNYCNLYSATPLTDFGLAVGDSVNISLNAGYCFIAFKNSEKTRILNISTAGGESKTATIPQGSEYIEIVLYCKNNPAVVDEEFNLDIYPILERGNTATSWEKAIRNTYNLTNGTPDQTINTLLGVNQIFADSGNISVEYRQDIKMLINALT